MTCTKCGQPLREGAMFCGKCGAGHASRPVCKICGVEPPADGSPVCLACQRKAAAQCPSCGADRQPGKRFCRRCGMPVERDAPAVAAPAGASAAVSSMQSQIEPGPARPREPLSKPAASAPTAPLQRPRPVEVSPDLHAQPGVLRRHGRLILVAVTAVFGILLGIGAVLYVLGTTLNLQTEVPDASVALDGRTVGQTGPDGAFAVSRVRAGRHVITVSKPNWIQATENVPVSLFARTLLLKVQVLPVGGTVPRSGSNQVALLNQLPSWFPVPTVSPANYPPQPFRDIDACPGEGCSYGRWRAKRDVLLYAGIGSGQLAGQASGGEFVDVPNGAVVTLRAGIQRLQRPLQLGPARVEAGELLYTLTYHGEGAWLICYRGQLSTTVALLEAGASEELAKPTSEWWVRVAGATGEIGWTKDVEAFTGKSRYDPNPPETQGVLRPPPGPSAEELVARAQTLFSARRYTEALQDCEQALRSDPQNGSARKLKRQIEDTMQVLGLTR
jgi:zinc-ribbon domain/PEGA domain